MSFVSDLIKYSRLAFGLREFLHNTISLEESKQIISNRLRNREKNFLNLVQTGICRNKKSPYLKLFEISGCEFGDIESLVNKDGIENTLSRLMEDGVYLSWEEFKGKKEIVRGSCRFRFSERDFDNPFLPVYYQTQSSGSRSIGTRTTFDLHRMAEMSPYRSLMLAIHNALDVHKVIWEPILPARSGISNVLRSWKVGKPVDKWFSPVDERQVQSSLQHRLAMKYIMYGSRLWGAKLAKPEYVRLEEAAKVAKYISEVRKQFGRCSCDCYVSLAVMVCQAAAENGLNIEGTLFFCSGEPLTPAKRQQVEAVGASIIPRYAISEIGGIAYGCPRDTTSDDMHLLKDTVALIQRRRKVEHVDIHVDSFLFTTLLPSAPMILLNVESDDYGFLTTQNCGCPYSQLGLDKHLNNIRSFSKLTGSGMTIVGTDFVRILEEVLPGKYGGASTDYQLLEEEDSHGQTSLNLVISPTIGKIDESDVLATVINELRRSAYSGKLAAGLWSQANILRVKRMHPISKMGKVMSLHLMKKE